MTPAIIIYYSYYITSIMKKNLIFIQPTLHLKEKSNNQFSVRIACETQLTGPARTRWQESPGGDTKILANVTLMGDDGHTGDDILFRFSYPLKLSNNASDPIRDRHNFGTWVDREVLNEDKYIHKEDEIYAVIEATIHSRSNQYPETVISEKVSTNILKINL